MAKQDIIELLMRIYDKIDQLDNKLDTKIERLEARVSALEVERGRLVGIAGILAFLASAAVSVGLKLLGA